MSVLTRRYSRSDEVTLKLVRGEITIGQANEQYMKAHADNQSDWKQAADAIMAGLNQQHAAEMQQRQAAAQAMQNSLYQQQQLQMQQQMLMRSYAPVQTNCQRIGNSVSCTSY